MNYLKTTLLALTLCGLWACDSKKEPDEPSQPQENIPASFPRKHLIEEFTGQDCGYCPYGMNCVHSFMGTDSNYVLVLHHYGYQADHFSVIGSKTIQKALAVNGAPNVSFNRSKTKYEDGASIVFHPVYFETMDKSQFANETYASIVLTNTYDAASRQLKVHVRGALCNDSHPALNLTVLVKESGMIDYQADYFYTYEGWQEFCHANAVRAYLTDPKGNAITVDDTRHYEADYTLTLNSKWNPDNCMVVAFLSEDFKPVIQAEQKPVVNGTKGGADILHRGVTEVPVEDYYPEPGPATSPADISLIDTLTFPTANAYYTHYPTLGLTLWTVEALGTTSFPVSNVTCIPLVQLYVLTEYKTPAALPEEGVYPFNLTENPATVLAGYRDDETHTISGSGLYYISKSYYNQGYYVPYAQWLITDGELTVTSDGWSVSGHARNGAPVIIKGTTPFHNSGKASAPQRLVSPRPLVGPRRILARP